MLFGRTKSLVGLDIGSSSVKAIELKSAGKGFRVSAIGVESVPPDSIVDGAIIDGGAVADAVRRLFANKRFKAKDVVASLSGNSVIVKDHSAPLTEATSGRSIGRRAIHPFDSSLNHRLRDLNQGTEAVWKFCLGANKDRSAITPTSFRSRKGPVIVARRVCVQNAFEANYVEPSAVVALPTRGEWINLHHVGFAVGGSRWAAKRSPGRSEECICPMRAQRILKKGQDATAPPRDARGAAPMTDNVLLESRRRSIFKRRRRAKIASSHHARRRFLARRGFANRWRALTPK